MPSRFMPYLPSFGLGFTQIIGYGTLMYAYAILLPVMADELGLSLSSVFGILSLALFFGGLVSPLAGVLVDRFGGRYVMSIGSMVAGLAVVSLSQIEDRYGLFFAILLAEGAGMFVLYNVAFAAVARLESPVPTPRSISIITLFGGVASTIYWPLTLALETRWGWQMSWIILGTVLLVTCVPIHFFVLNGKQKPPAQSDERERPDWPQLHGVARKRGMIWMIVTFIFSGYLMGAVMTLWVTNVQDLGHTAAMAALAGAIIGPFKTVGRALEMLVSRNLYPLITYLLAVSLMMSGFIIPADFWLYGARCHNCCSALWHGRRYKNHRSRYAAAGAVWSQRLRHTTWMDIVCTDGCKCISSVCVCMDDRELRWLVEFCQYDSRDGTGNSDLLPDTGP